MTDSMGRLIARADICQYADCPKDLSEAPERVRVTISWGTGGKGQREGAGFCCRLHAAQWLQDSVRFCEPHGRDDP
jgi:hypothetical protein